jgi:hypothetical protein
MAGTSRTIGHLYDASGNRTRKFRGHEEIPGTRYFQFRGHNT